LGFVAPPLRAASVSLSSRRLSSRAYPGPPSRSCKSSSANPDRATQCSPARNRGPQRAPPLRMLGWWKRWVQVSQSTKPRQPGSPTCAACAHAGVGVRGDTNLTYKNGPTGWRARGWRPPFRSRQPRFRALWKPCRSLLPPCSTASVRSLLAAPAPSSLHSRYKSRERKADA